MGGPHYYRSIGAAKSAGLRRTRRGRGVVADVPLHEMATAWPWQGRNSESGCSRPPVRLGCLMSTPKLVWSSAGDVTKRQEDLEGIDLLGGLIQQRLCDGGVRSYGEAVDLGSRSRAALGLVLVLPSLHLLPSHCHVGSTNLPLASTVMFYLTQCQHPGTETITLHHLPQVAAIALHPG